MNLLVTILSLTPAVGAMFRLLEDRPKVMAQPQKSATGTTRRARLRQPRRGNHARLATWRRRKQQHDPLRSLRAA